MSRRQWWLLAGGVLALAAWGVGQMLRANDDDAWRRIQQRGVITFVTDPTYPPFESLDGNGELIGFDIELAHALASRMGLRAEFETVSYDGLIGTLVTGRDDAVLSAYVIQPERGKEASFTPPYFDAGSVLIVPADAPDVRPNSLQAWSARKTLAAEYGTEGDALLRRWSRLVVGLTPVAAPDALSAMQAVAEGNADGAVVEAVAAYEFVSGAPQVKIAGHVPELSAPYAIAVSARSAVLLRELTRALAAMEADGSLGDLRAKWFGEAAR